MLRTHDDWERLVAAVIKKQQLWELFHSHSRSSSEASSSSDLSSNSSFREIDNTTSAELENPIEKLVLISDFVPPFDVKKGINLTSLDSLVPLEKGTLCNTYVVDVNDMVKIVVKRVKKKLIVSQDEFKRSMEVVGRLRQENIVALRAYYSSEDEKLMLYDYYIRGCVHQLLHGKTSFVRWQTRLRIAIGAARGLASLHSQKLVHGNVKSSNILLNKEWYGCISDHGITNLTSVELAKNSHCYAPEVKNGTQNMSQESDVYSFGILIFELLTRKSPVHIRGKGAVNLIKLIKSVKGKPMTTKVFDEVLVLDHYIREQMVEVLQIGISCVDKSPKRRPKMSKVAMMLNDVRGSNLKINDRLEFVRPNYESTSEDPFDLHGIFTASWEDLGKGTFGTSYKANLSTGQKVRVKRLTDTDVNVTSAEFQQFVGNISTMKRKRCTTAMAYCFSKCNLFLVYDHHEMSLSALLHGTASSRPRGPFPWRDRLKIALTSAKGIHHIHKQDSWKLVHGNISSSNILLDRQNSAIIADATLSKVTKPITHSIMKQKGYLAPEVEDTTNVSQASDVYGFGVVLLELLIGKPPMEKGSGSGAISFVEWVQVQVHEKCTLDKLFDAELVGNREKFVVFHLALECVEAVPQRRPRMSEVVKKLQQLSWIYEDETEPSIDFGSKDSKSKARIGMTLEDQMSRLAIQQW